MFSIGYFCLLSLHSLNLLQPFFYVIIYINIGSPGKDKEKQNANSFLDLSSRPTQDRNPSRTDHSPGLALLASCLTMVGGTVWKAVQKSVMTQPSLCFFILWLELKMSLKNYSKKETQKGRICAKSTIITEHLPELTVFFVTIILCRNVHDFCHRTVQRRVLGEL